MRHHDPLVRLVAPIADRLTDNQALAITAIAIVAGFIIAAAL